MTDTSGPRGEQPSEPGPMTPGGGESPDATRPLPTQPPSQTQPPTPEQLLAPAPGAPAGDASEPQGFASQGYPVPGAPYAPVPPPARPTVTERVRRRPVLAGVLGGVLIALIAFGGGFAGGFVVGHAVGGRDGGLQMMRFQDRGDVGPFGGRGQRDDGDRTDRRGSGLPSTTDGSDT